MDQMTESTRQRTAFGAWYERNAEEHNAERKARYHADPETRRKAVSQARAYRQKVKAEGKLPPLRNGMYTLPRVAHELGVSTQTMRNWETKSFIPKPTVEGTHRLYTEKQVNLLKTMIASSGNRAEFEAARTTLFVEWESE